ncbi:MAG: transposase [Pseudomonadota bacterium]
MSNFQRRYVPEHTHFFTARLQDPASDMLVSQIGLLRDASRTVIKRWPFEIAGAVILPNKLHMIWVLPNGDVDFAKRWRLVKSTFARHAPASLSQGTGSGRIWHRSLWHHVIRDIGDYDRHMHVIASSPVQAGLVKRAADWPFSSLHAGTERVPPELPRTTALVPSNPCPKAAVRAN